MRSCVRRSENSEALDGDVRGARRAFQTDGRARRAAEVLQAREVFLHLAVFAEPRHDFREDLRGARVFRRGDAVVHPLALAARGDDARAAQVREVSRNLRLVHPQNFHEEADADLAALYRGCLFALYPSLYEGWGLPVSEALANGKFCVCSNQGALPEAGQDFVDYADPWDVDEWANKILRYIGTPSAVAQREFDIKHDFREVSWRDSAAHVLAVASRLAE